MSNEFFGDGKYQLIIGDSFSKSKQKRQKTEYHALRYDFKPASVDENNGFIELSEDSVVMTHPTTTNVNTMDAGDQDNIVYRGNRRPSNRDCFIVVDKVNKRLIIERVSFLISLKRTQSLASTNPPEARKLPEKISDFDKTAKPVRKTKLTRKIDKVVPKATLYPNTQKTPKEPVNKKTDVNTSKESFNGRIPKKPQPKKQNTPQSSQYDPQPKKRQRNSSPVNKLRLSNADIFGMSPELSPHVKSKSVAVVKAANTHNLSDSESSSGLIEDDVISNLEGKTGNLDDDLMMSSDSSTDFLKS